MKPLCQVRVEQRSRFGGSVIVRFGARVFFIFAAGKTPGPFSSVLPAISSKSFCFNSSPLRCSWVFASPFCWQFSSRSGFLFGFSQSADDDGSEKDGFGFFSRFSAFRPGQARSLGVGARARAPLYVCSIRPHWCKRSTPQQSDLGGGNANKHRQPHRCCAASCPGACFR